MQVVVVTPELTALETEAEFVALPLYDGEIGIAPNHAPMIGRLGPGEMRVEHAGSTRRFYIDGGFVQVVDNTVSVMTSRAMPSDKLDITAAEKQLAAASKEPITSPELEAIRDRQVTQARAQIAAARKAK